VDTKAEGSGSGQDLGWQSPYHGSYYLSDDEVLNDQGRRHIALLPGGLAFSLYLLKSVHADSCQWRARKMPRVDPGGPRETQRWTVHVEKRWIERVKAQADLEGVSQAEIVDRALRPSCEGDRSWIQAIV
jgi:hypothetical protein